jgi:hypothetical protein
LASGCVYVLSSGLAFNPRAFLTHVKYITGRGGGYYKYAASLQGYFGLLVETFGWIAATLSWPILIAALVGVLLSICRSRTALWLLLTLPGLFLFALAPIRVVQLRFVLAVSWVLACFAGYAVSRLFDSRRWASLGTVLTLALVAYALVRPLELMRLQLSGGSRVQASQWLAGVARSGDRVEYFGLPPRFVLLPRLPPGVTWLFSRADRSPGGKGPEAEFVLLQGVADLGGKGSAETPNHPREGCPAWIRRGLADGSLEYDLGARVRVPTYFRHVDFGVNPLIEVYAKRGLRAPARAGNSRTQ